MSVYACKYVTIEEEKVEEALCRCRTFGAGPFEGHRCSGPEEGRVWVVVSCLVPFLCLVFWIADFACCCKALLAFRFSDACLDFSLCRCCLAQMADSSSPRRTLRIFFAASANTIMPPLHLVPEATGIQVTVRPDVQVPIWRPSGEQTD